MAGMCHFHATTVEALSFSEEAPILGRSRAADICASSADHGQARLGAFEERHATD